MVLPPELQGVLRGADHGDPRPCDPGRTRSKHAAMWSDRVEKPTQNFVTPSERNLSIDRWRPECMKLRKVQPIQPPGNPRPADWRPARRRRDRAHDYSREAGRQWEASFVSCGNAGLWMTRPGREHCEMNGKPLPVQFIDGSRVMRR